MAKAFCPKCKEPWKIEGRNKNYSYCAHCRNDLSRQASLAGRYGLTLEDYDAMVAEQDNLCAICGNPETQTFKRLNSGIKRLAVDHCHDTGEVRGLLCHNCNVGLGYFKDNADALFAASNYIKFHTK